jgi:hypothetical protein
VASGSIVLRVSGEYKRRVKSVSSPPRSDDDPQNPSQVTRVPRLPGPPSIGSGRESNLWTGLDETRTALGTSDSGVRPNEGHESAKANFDRPTRSST